MHTDYRPTTAPRGETIAAEAARIADWQPRDSHRPEADWRTPIARGSIAGALAAVLSAAASQTADRITVDATAPVHGPHGTGRRVLSADVPNLAAWTRIAVEAARMAPHLMGGIVGSVTVDRHDSHGLAVTFEEVPVDPAD